MSEPQFEVLVGADPVTGQLPAPTEARMDTVVAEHIDNPDSDTRASLNATYVARTDAEKMAPFHAALANRDLVRCSIAVFGDSIVEHAFVSAFNNTWTHRLARMLRAAFPVAGTLVGVGGLGFVSPKVLSGTPQFTWPGVESGTVAGSSGGGPKKQVRGYAASGSGQVTYTITGTSATIWGLKTSGTQTLTWTVDGGAATPLAFGGGTSPRLVSHTISLGASGAHTLVLAATAGQPNIIGIVAYDGDETAGIHVHNCGRYGSSSANFNDANVTVWAQDTAAILNPDLVIIALGVNDSALSVATTKTNLESLLTALRTNQTKPTTYMLLADYTPDTNIAATWPARVAAMQEIADASTDTVFLDIRAYMADVAGGDPLGLYWADGLHLENKGAAMLASVVHRFIAPRM